MRGRSVRVIGFSTWRQVPGARASPPLSVSVLLVVWSYRTFAAEMVAVAAKRASTDAQMSTAVFDQNAIDFGDASFDAVINRHGLMFVEDPAQTVAEAVRVLRPRGRYAVMTWDRREVNPWLGPMLDAVSAQFGVPFPPPHVRGPFSLDTPDVLSSVLRDGGLEDVTVEAMATPMNAASLEEW